MTAPEDCRRIVLELVALPDLPGGPPAIYRLRRLLKQILRSAGWRCVAAEPKRESGGEAAKE